MLDVQINRIHSGAICNEIGERLGPQSNELPDRLLAVIDELEKVEPPALPSEARSNLNA